MDFAVRVNTLFQKSNKTVSPLQKNHSEEGKLDLAWEHAFLKGVERGDHTILRAVGQHVLKH